MAAVEKASSLADKMSLLYLRTGMAGASLEQAVQGKVSTLRDSPHLSRCCQNH